VSPNEKLLRRQHSAGSAAQAREFARDRAGVELIRQSLGVGRGEGPYVRHEEHGALRNLAGDVGIFTESDAVRLADGLNAGTIPGKLTRLSS